MRTAGPNRGPLRCFAEDGIASARRITAVLGPTNTGKTHFAVERLLAHRSGMMGFPLRLLAREIYDRVVALKGASSVALITGEEKIGADHAAYVIATVEAMPVDRDVAFLAVDEIQLCADPDRGHIFTDRLLHARGREETIFLGSDTIRPLLRRLVPEAEIVTRPRFSTLTHTGACKLARLPRRSAIVAFTASEVYTLAEMVRRRRGGAAVILGSLSPRTRNAQVELYQSGEVDHLVATDAIGMGLNMDLGHVTFADWQKFDGREQRRLTAAEIGQIAGRAGRHMRDGSFGTTSRAEPFDERTVLAVESHSFQTLRALRWRNAALDFGSLDRLTASLDAPPPADGLIKVRDALDDRCLALLSRRHDVARCATSRDMVGLLWQVCQIPDFRKTLTDAHLELLAAIFSHLAGRDGRLPSDWVAAMIARLERTDGDIDTLVSRIAHVRTWTYLSHRKDWLHDAGHWQERARAVEDKLSDALHERLTQKFVDRRTAALLRSLRPGAESLAQLEDNGEVVVDGHQVGKLDGFRFELAKGDEDVDRKILAAAARRAVSRELAALATRLIDAADDDLVLDQDLILWNGAAVGRCAAGARPLTLGVCLIASDLVPEGLRNAMQRRLEQWLDGWLEQAIGPLRELARRSNDAALGPAGRGLAYRLVEARGVLPSKSCEDVTSILAPLERKLLARCGVRIGIYTVHMPALLRPVAMRALALLAGRRGDGALATPPAGRVNLRRSEWDQPDQAYGYVRAGDVALRVDIAERLGAELRREARAQARFEVPGALLALSGLSRDEFMGALPELGFRASAAVDGAIQLQRARRSRRRPEPRSARKANAQRGAPSSPFAVLAQLKGSV